MKTKNSEFAQWLDYVGSGPEEKTPAKKKPDSPSLIKGTPFQVADIISLLRSTAIVTKHKHPRSSGKMFSDIAQESGNGEPVRAGRGGAPMRLGANNVWYYPGGAPPGYPTPGPLEYVTIMESGTIW